MGWAGLRHPRRCSSCPAPWRPALSANGRSRPWTRSPARARPERGLIDAVGRAERRADLGEGAEALHLLLVEQEVLRAGLGPDALPLGLRALDALEAEPRRQVNDVDGAVGEPADQDGAIDRFLFRPVRTGRREVGRRRAA